MDASATVIIGNRTVTLDDVALIAEGTAPVKLDTAVIEQIRAGDLKRIDAAAVADVEIAADADTLSAHETRAVITAVLTGLMQTKARVRAAVLEFLANLLNANLLPVLARPNTGADLVASLTGLALAANGSGNCLENGAVVPLREACARVDEGIAFVSPRVSQLEIDLIAQPAYYLNGLASLCAYGVASLARGANVVAALACEVAETPLDAFSYDKHEAARAHKGQTAAALTLRVLTIASGQRPKTKSTAGAAAEFVNVPEYHGQAIDEATSASITARVETNAGVIDAKTYHAAAIAAAARKLQTAVTILVDGSVARTTAIAAIAGTSAGEAADYAKVLHMPISRGVAATIDTAVSTLHSVYNAVPAAVQVLSAEAALSLNTLSSRAASKYASAQAKLAAKAKAKAAHAAASGNKNATPAGGEPAEPPKPGSKEAKAAKKRADKAAKQAAAAQKKAEKEAKLVVGDGVAQLQEFFGAAFTPPAAAPSADAADAAGAGAGAGAGADTAAAAAGAVTSVTAADVAAKLSPFANTYSNLYSMLQPLLDACSSGGVRRKPKIHKGTRDFLPAQMEVRERCFNTIRSVFRRHGAQEIDTPVFELRDTLMGKYGEEGGKLIYDLADQGGELLCLRYDLTVPFARFLAMHNTGNIKRFHIAKVYRRDNPVASRGRYREFYQCDFDIAGSYETMMPDAEVLKVCTEILADLKVGPFKLKLNHRVLLDAMLDVCGVPAAKFRTICSAIDKLDKEPWETVKQEMVVQKGLSEESADQIGEFVTKLVGEPAELLAIIEEGDHFKGHPKAVQALSELKMLFGYLKAMNCLQYISFDLSLARGLDYYTGVIYEAVLTSSSDVGSVAAGGRYDHLVGMFSSNDVPCVGVSIGIERVFTIMERQAAAAGGLKPTPVDVMVASVGPGLTQARMDLLNMLWSADVSAEMVFKANPRMDKQLNPALEAGVPFLVTIGSAEVEAGTVKLKVLATKEQFDVPRNELVSRIKALQAAATAAGTGTGAGAGAGVATEAVEVTVQ